MKRVRWESESLPGAFSIENAKVLCPSWLVRQWIRHLTPLPYLSLAGTVCGLATRTCVANAWSTATHAGTFRVRSHGSEYLVNREWSAASAADAERRCGFRPKTRGSACGLLLNTGVEPPPPGSQPRGITQNGRNTLVRAGLPSRSSAWSCKSPNFCSLTKPPVLLGFCVCRSLSQKFILMRGFLQRRKRLGLRSSAIRCYEVHGLLSSQRLPNGYRVYDDDAIAALRFVRRAQAFGMTLHEIRQLLELSGGGQQPCVRV